MLDIENTRKIIQQLYLAYLGRPADPSGMEYWLTYFDNNRSPEDLAKEISKQDEYLLSLPTENEITGEINRIYLNLFSRNSDCEGINYWKKKIEESDKHISDIVLDLIWSTYNPADKNLLQSTEDLLTLNKKIKAADLFLNELKKSTSLLNAYQPKSFDPWETSLVFKLVKSFFSKIDHQYEVSIQKIILLLESLKINDEQLSSEPALEMKNISLRIPIYSNDKRNLSKIMVNAATGGNFFKSKSKLEVEALSNINLSIMHGERVALIGHNGSGKSSFLRLISGIYTPSSGELNINLEVYPMLQKSFLTSTELSGIDAAKAHYLLINNNLNGFDQFIEDIISFSGLGAFISLPIKSYSEGMCARLIFSILTSTKHNCIAIDEGIGTGDASFYEKAEKRLQSFLRSAGTLFLASHSEVLLKQFCIRGLVFNQGSIVFDGSLDAALNYYHHYGYFQQNDQ